VRMRLDAGAGVFDAEVRTSTLSEERLEVRVQCTVDNCVGCQSNPPQLRHVDLQSKCHAAERCGVQRCVGTPIDMRKPLCNIALVLLEPLNAVRIVMHSGWKLIASTIIGMVELTKPRQSKFAWEFPSRDMMQLNCLVKNTIVETASIFSSSLNLVVRLVGLADDNFIDDRLRSSILDSRWYARQFMSTTALTNLVASPFLFFVYEAMVIQKVFTCASTDLVAIVVDVGTGKAGGDTKLVVMSQNDATQRQNKKSVAGLCLNQRMSGRVREMGLEAPVGTSVANEFTAIADRLTGIGTSTIIQFNANVFDTTIATAIGVTSSFLDWVQTIDWKHCSLPVMQNSQVFRCACGDRAHVIPAARRIETASHGAFWCTGPMFVTDMAGNDRLIWNPYSLEQLLGGDSHEAFIACLARGASCEKERFKLALLERQGVNVLPVATRCRDNYKNKQCNI